MKTTKTQGNKTIKPKLYWNQSQYAWLVGIKPFEGEKAKTKANPAVVALCRRLLELGGKRVCMYFTEHELVCFLINQVGHTTSPKGIKLVHGEPSQCHRNVARIWKRDKRGCTIYSGFALHDDQMWRRHSWLVDKNNRIIETTVKAKKYFGYRFEGERAELFCKVASLPSKLFQTTRRNDIKRNGKAVRGFKNVTLAS
jgi:hypothetical protein